MCNYLKKFLLQFSDFIRSFCHQLEASPEGYNVLENLEKGLKSISKKKKKKKKNNNFDLLEVYEACRCRLVLTLTISACVFVFVPVSPLSVFTGLGGRDAIPVLDGKHRTEPQHAEGEGYSGLRRSSVLQLTTI